MVLNSTQLFLATASRRGKSSINGFALAPSPASITAVPSHSLPSQDHAASDADPASELAHFFRPKW
jgi:hypothetical protein